MLGGIDLRNYFSRNYSKLKYPKADKKTNGLRNAQLGAIHSISSFFTLNKSKAAIVVMPTGARVIIVTGCINTLVSRVSETFIKKIMHYLE